MSIGAHIRAWRLSRGHSLEHVAARANLAAAALESIESGETDPTVSLLDGVAQALNVPVSRLFVDPKHIPLLYSDGADDEPVPADSPDPVVDRMLRTSRSDRELYVLLTALVQSGEPKLLRAAEASLRSLVKQSRQTTVPWQSRPPGHFEPPSD